MARLVTWEIHHREAFLQRSACPLRSATCAVASCSLQQWRVAIRIFLLLWRRLVKQRGKEEEATAKISVHTVLPCFWAILEISSQIIDCSALSDIGLQEWNWLQPWSLSSWTVQSVDYIGTRAKYLAYRNVNKPQSMISLIAFQLHQTCIEGLPDPSRFFSGRSRAPD